MKKSFFKNSISFILLLCFFGAFAQYPEDEAKARVLQIDQQKLNANLAFKPEDGLISGEVTIHFKNATKNLDSLWLDGIQMNYKGVLLDGDIVNYKIEKKGLSIFPDRPLVIGSEHTLQLIYTANPKRGMYFLGWNDPSGKSRKQIWTQGQGIDNRHWIPHVDAQNDKLVCGLSILFDKDYEVLSNGSLVNFEENGSTNIWTYQMETPMSSYLMMIAIGKYEKLTEKSLSKVSLENYYYPEWENRNEWTYYKNKELFDWMENEIGIDYPWQGYRQVPVKDFQHGAMENTSATIFGDFYCVDEISFNDEPYFGVNAHELTHQWFGNYVTALSSHDHWLHEGFATYYSWLAEEEFFGKKRFDAIRLNALAHIEADNLTNEFPLQHSKAGSTKFYEMGAWVLHMLREEMDEETFKMTMQNYLNKNAEGMVVSSDLIQTSMEVSGQDLERFFQQWLVSPKMPIIRFKASFNENDSKLSLSFTQEQKINSRRPPYLMTIPVIIKTDKDEYRYDVKIGDYKKNLNFFLKKGENVRYIEVDPGLNHLVSWNFDLPLEWKLNQFKHGESRLMSCLLLKGEGPKGLEEKQVKDLNIQNWPDYAQKHYISFVVNNENFSEKYLKTQVENASVDAKRAYLNIKEIPKSHEKMVRSWLKASSYLLQEEALLKLFTSFRENADDYLELTEGVNGTRGNNVLVMHELVNYISSNRERGHQSLIDLTGEQYDFLTRMKALEVISVVRLEPDQYLLENLFQGLFQGNRRWRSAAKSYLQNAYKNENIRADIDGYMEAHKDKWEDWQLKRVEVTFGDID
ncbi:MAG: M1 family metallopeptidase [Schleiferiaceae bacterium]|nr:M1 family metallopeptidase [Schleiferiaceae bacterium]